MKKFINRENELKELNQKWASKTPQLFVLYGKRRVGKTELIKQFIKNKPSVYFMGDKRTTRDQLLEVGRLLGSFFKDVFIARNGFKNWLEVFEYLKSKFKKKFVFAIDEYPYLVEVDKSASSLFQKGWDEYLKDIPIFLILSGSSISMMESEALLYQSPLYGRRTGQILLKPLSFFQAWKFFPKKSFTDFLRIYTICGGMPSYLLQINPDLSMEENIIQKIFKKTEFLHQEIEFILKEELREPKNYMAILKAIAWGKTKYGEIINETGLEKNIIQKYLSVLENLQLIERETPVTEKHPQKSRKGIYKISDYFTRFWFQYVYPYKSDLEIERFDEPLRKFRENFPTLEALTYERVCQEILLNLNLFRFERVGRWWDKNQEIDLAAINSEKKEILFGEAKWSNKPVGSDIFLKLKEKSSFVEWNKGDRKESFILFSRSGFTADLIKMAGKNPDLFLVKGCKLLRT